jgi:hypothetical protein
VESLHEMPRELLNSPTVRLWGVRTRLDAPLTLTNSIGLRCSLGTSPLLKQERSRLNASIRALEGVGGGGSAPAKRRGRPPYWRDLDRTTRDADFKLQAHRVSSARSASVRRHAC